MLPSVCSITNATRATRACLARAASGCQNTPIHARRELCGTIAGGETPVTRCLILAAGRFDPAETASAVAADREPRLDVFELARALSAEVLDFKDVDASRSAVVRASRRALGASAALALLGAERAAAYDAILTTGEDIGI